MRSARYKTIPKNRKVPFGIARQRELLDLVERRFAQAELLRYAVSRARGAHDIAALAADETASADHTSAEDSASASADHISAGESASAFAEHTSAGDSASASADHASAGESASASAEGKTDRTADAPSAADDTASDDTAASADAPLHSVTVVWHGKEETIEHPEVWLDIFADVSEAGDAITRELMRRRFRDEPYWKTCDALYISHSAYYQNVREILHYTLACAVSYGILDPRPKHPAESA